MTITITATKNDSGEPVLHLASEQVATGGIRNTESHFLDWTHRESSDMIAGVLAGNSRFIRGKKGENGKVLLDFDIQSRVEGNEEATEKIRKFLRGEILANGSPSSGWLVENPDSEVERLGEGEGVWMQNFTTSKNQGWTNEQVCYVY